MGSWIDHELQSLDLGDQRLNQRGRNLLERFYADSQGSVNAACQGWAETQAAYRFFDNPRVEPDDILAPHQQATLERVRQHAVVLQVQDTTELDYDNHPPVGAGPLTSKTRLGFLDHSHLAFTPEGLCLGVVDVDIWARSFEGFGDSKKRQYDPLESKETYRWLQGYRLACQTAAQAPDTQIISVADCEGDIYEIFVEAEKLRAENKPAADYVIRAGKNRCLTEKDAGAGPDTYCKLRQQMAKAPVLVRKQLDLPATPKRAARTASLEICAQKLHLKAPYRKDTTLPDLGLNVVLVREVDAPEGAEPIEWLLITSLPIDTVDEVLAVVTYYTGRWPIEIFFRVYKSGCQVERIQLETVERLQPCLMLYKIVAWRVLYVTMLGRDCPDLPCDTVFSADEWKPVWRITQNEPIPRRAPPLNEFVQMLGSLGGHNGRRSDGPPGPQALWVGIRRMTDFALAWQMFGPENHHRPPDSKSDKTICV